MSAAIAAVAVSAGVGLMQGAAAEDAEDAQYAANQAQLALNAEDRAKLQRLIRRLPKQERDATARMMAAYAKQRNNLEQAKVNGDAQYETIFAIHAKQIEDALELQLGKIGENYREYIDETEAVRVKYKDLLADDQRINAMNKKQYDEDTAAGFDLIKEGNEVFSQQVQHIKDTGYDQRSADIIAKAEDKASKVLRQVEEVEAQIGKGGAGSRKAAAAFEKIRTVAEVKQDAADSSADTLNEAAKFAQIGEMLAGRRTEVLKATEGREQIDLESKIDEAQIAGGQDRRAAELGAVVASNQAGDASRIKELETQAQRDEAFSRELGAIDLTEAQGKEAIVERTQDREAQFTTGQIQQTRAMSDVYRNMAATEGQKAANLNQQAAGAFSSLGSMLAMGAVGSQGGLPGQGHGDTGFKGFGQGVLMGGLGIKPKGFYNSPSSGPMQGPQDMQRAYGAYNPNSTVPFRGPLLYGS